MSVNAYRRKRNSEEFESPSFNIWHDEKLIELFNEQMQFYMSLNSYGTGIVDVPVQGCGVELGEDVDLPQAGVDAVRDGDVDQAELAAERDGRLGALGGERIQPLAPASAQDDGYYLLHILPRKSV